MPISACCLQYTGVLLPSTLKLGVFVQASCKQRLLRTCTMPSSACCLQCDAVLPGKLKLGCFVHKPCEQRLLEASTIPSIACCLQYSAFPPPSMFKTGRLVQE